MLRVGRHVVVLPPIQARLAAALLERRNAVVSRETLLRQRAGPTRSRRTATSSTCTWRGSAALLADTGPRDPHRAPARVPAAHADGRPPQRASRVNVTDVLVDILVVLLAAKLAAELAERVDIPAVVGEILAGILIGPSVLDLVGHDATLEVLAELGVILLLLDVGLELSLGDLRSVGRSSMSVATIGVVLPVAMGFGVALGFGESSNTALFVGAALAATSVGITARVFSDLGALTRVEARTVIGAAVADDVMGLVLLTIVVRVVTAGTVVGARHRRDRRRSRSRSS